MQNISIGECFHA